MIKVCKTSMNGTRNMPEHAGTLSDLFRPEHWEPISKDRPHVPGKCSGVEGGK